MDNQFISKEFNSVELQEMISEYFLSSEINEGYRYFPKNSININFKNRKIIFSLKEEEKGFGAKDFNSRVVADKDFLNKSNLGFISGFIFEEKMFNLDIKENNLQKALNYNNPHIGGKAVITQTSMYMDSSGELFIAIPLASPDETYGLQGKLTGANMIIGSSFIKVNDILKNTDPKFGKKESNKLFDIQKENTKYKIIEELNDFKFGEWSVRFQLPNGKYSEIKNVHIGRANDGAFEILTSKIYKSYEDIISNFDIKENIGYKRPIGLVKVSDLLNNTDGEDLNIQKLL